MFDPRYLLKYRADERAVALAPQDLLGFLQRPFFPLCGSVAGPTAGVFSSRFLHALPQQGIYLVFSIENIHGAPHFRPIPHEELPTWKLSPAGICPSVSWRIVGKFPDHRLTVASQIEKCSISRLIGMWPQSNSGRFPRIPFLGSWLPEPPTTPS
jgi:hypothetical protein